MTNTGEGDESPAILQVDTEGKNPDYFTKTREAIPNAIEIIGDTVYLATEFPAILGFTQWLV